MKHFSPQATDKTPQCEKFSDADMVANVRHCDLLKSVKGNMPETTRKLLPVFELIEKLLLLLLQPPKVATMQRGSLIKGAESKRSVPPTIQT
jgi:hypothetical protein